MLTSKDLIFVRKFDGFLVRYYLTTGPMGGADIDLAEMGSCYGVMLEKAVVTDDVVEAAAVPLSETKDDVLRVIQALWDMEVTPMSLFEVIDRTMELADLI